MEPGQPEDVREHWYLMRRVLTRMLHQQAGWVLDAYMPGPLGQLVRYHPGWQQLLRQPPGRAVVTWMQYRGQERISYVRLLEQLADGREIRVGLRRTHQPESSHSAWVIEDLG